MKDRLNAEQAERYQAHLALPRIGANGQRRLLRSRVLMVGVGGLGCPTALYLTASGVGTLGLLDDDIVDRTNLQRQVLYGTSDIGKPKVHVARERLAGINPDVDLKPIEKRLTPSNAMDLVSGWDLVIDGSDNFASRYVVNDACVLSRIPLISGSVFQFEGQVTVIRPPLGPCYRCLFRTIPQEQPACRDAGVLAPLTGIIGSVLAAEAVKWLVEGDTALMGRLLLVDVLEASTRSVRVKSDPTCPLCGKEPTIERPTAVSGCHTSD